MKKKEIDMSKYTIGIDPYDKQETPEEAAERIYPMVSNEYLWHIPIETRKIFIEGTKWQQERSYSEEEFKEIIYHMVGGLAQANNMTFNGAILDELFNKFKKK
jgi:hypothetical protein